MLAQLTVSRRPWQLLNSGNVILSRFPLRHATSIIFKATKGWQSFVPNGALHAATGTQFLTSVHGHSLV